MEFLGMNNPDDGLGIGKIAVTGTLVRSEEKLKCLHSSGNDGDGKYRTGRWTGEAAEPRTDRPARSPVSGRCGTGWRADMDRLGDLGSRACAVNGDPVRPYLTA